VEVVDNPSLIAACDAFHNTLATGDLKAICASKASSASSVHEAQVWTLMKIICFEKNAREELLSFLGFDAASIEAAAQSFVASHASESSHAGLNTAFDELHLSGSSASAAEESIRNALVVGNFAAAVDICVEANLMAEALLLAQCGDPGLWTKTQNIFFEKFRVKRPFLNILHAVINGKLKDLVNASDLRRWRETLAIISTYGKSEEFAELCELLGNRLDAEDRNAASATLCLMCANNVPRTVAFWIEDLKHANAMLGQMDPIALQQFIEKVVVYTEANKSAGGVSDHCPDLATLQKLLPECAEFFAYYANLLASQGRLEIVSRYLRGDTQGECILRDRAYHAGGPKPAGSRPPQFPFVRVNVAMKAGTVSSIAGVGHASMPSKAQTVSPVKATAAVVQQVAVATYAEPQVSNKNAHPQAMYAAAEPVSQPAGLQLPPGWLQLVDPSSGRPYYVNQATSQSQWEPPVLLEPVAPIPAPVPVQPIVAASFPLASNVAEVHRVAEQPAVAAASAPMHMPAQETAMMPSGPAAPSSVEAVDSKSLDTLDVIIQSLMGNSEFLFSNSLYSDFHPIFL
jgi:protein transport protein SEC31